MEKKIYGIIYLLIDSINDKEYVGQTTQSLEVRFNQHKCGSQYVDNVIKKRGEMFLKVILKACYSKEELDYWEIRLIKSRDTMFPNGYNLTEGGEGGARCEEARLNISMVRRTESPYKNLIAEMDKRRLSYTALANLLGLTSVTVSDKLRGKSNFTVKAVDKLVEIFNLPAEYLLERDDGLSPITSEAERCKKISARVRHNSPFKNLLSEMEKRNLLYADLSKLLGLSVGTLSEKMNGTVKFTSKDIYKLVEIFGLPVEILLERDDGKEFPISKLNKTPYKNLICEMGLKQLSYVRLAELLNLSPCTVSEKMSGKSNFWEEEVAKLVEIFNKPAEYLLQRDDEKVLSDKTDCRSPFKNLLNEMNLRKLSYTGLAKLLGVVRTSVHKKMSCRQNFTEKDIAKLVEIFNKPAEYLLQRDGSFPIVMSKEAMYSKISATKRFDSLYKNLQSEIDSHQLSYRRLAELLGLSSCTVSEKMNGKYNFTEKDISKLVEIFGKPADYLMKRDE
ncbi:MAG: GIY-YIG nuclease family protein [Selenomonadaceae bacterium]|nr:GIY-YIG nuclease family protein [Selenomonadaceae bacterium]